MDRQYCGGRWSKARFNSFIKGLLRSGSKRWAVKFDVLNEAKRGKQTNSKTGRMAEHYECNACHNLFPLKDVEVDHVIPIMYEASSWDDVIDKMFCEKENLQVLCKECHKRKTKFERKNILGKRNQKTR